MELQRYKADSIKYLKQRALHGLNAWLDFIEIYIGV
jgi:hypothetical protein